MPMKGPPRPKVPRSKPAERQKEPQGFSGRGSAISELIWNVVSINAHLEDIHQVWAELLGVTEPQWLILLAIDQLDTGSGVSGIDLAGMIHVYPTFVTTQTKILEKLGFIARATSASDARFVLMSLTDKARRDILKFSSERDTLYESIFAGLGQAARNEFAQGLAKVRTNTERAARQLSLNHRFK